MLTLIAGIPSKQSDRPRAHLTVRRAVVGGCARLVRPRGPVGQPVLAQLEEGHGLEIQLAVRVGLGGHGHAVEKVGQDRVAGRGGTQRRDHVGGGLPRAVAAWCRGGGGRVVLDVGAGLGFPGNIFCRPVNKPIPPYSLDNF